MFRQTIVRFVLPALVPALFSLSGCVTARITATADEQPARALVDHARMVMLKRGTGWEREARTDIDQAERLFPQMDERMRSSLLVERAEINRLSGNLRSASADIAQAERLTPSDADPVASRALLLFTEGDERGGSEQLARALKLDPSHVRTRYIAMREARFSGDFKACVDHGTEALKVSPTDTQVLAMQARCLAELGRAGEAAENLRTIDAINPSIAYVFDDMALANLALNRPDKAVIAARRAVEMSPSFENAHFDLISALMATGADKEAIAAFQAFQASGLEDRVGVANNLSWELYLTGRHAEALRIAEEWLRAHPNIIDKPNAIANAKGHADVLDTAAHAQAALHLSDEAVTSFLRAAALNPDDLRPLYRTRLITLGFGPAIGDTGLESALRACVATGENCKLYVDPPRSGALAPNWP